MLYTSVEAQMLWLFVLSKKKLALVNTRVYGNGKRLGGAADFDRISGIAMDEKGSFQVDATRGWLMSNIKNIIIQYRHKVRRMQ